MLSFLIAPQETHEDDMGIWEVSCKTICITDPCPAHKLSHMEYIQSFSTEVFAVVYDLQTAILSVSGY